MNYFVVILEWSWNKRIQRRTGGEVEGSFCSSLKEESYDSGNCFGEISCKVLRTTNVSQGVVLIYDC